MINTGIRLHFIAPVVLPLALAACIPDPEFRDNAQFRSTIKQYDERSQASENAYNEANKPVAVVKVIRGKVSVKLQRVSVLKVVEHILGSARATASMDNVRLHGIITTSFTSLPLLDALNRLTNPQGVVVKKSGSKYHFSYDVAVNESSTDGVGYQEVELTHIDAASGVLLLRTLFEGSDGNAKFGALADINAIYITGSPKDVASAQIVLRRADRKIPHVLIEVLVVEFHVGDSSRYGTNITNLVENKLIAAAFLPSAGARNITFSFLDDNVTPTELTAAVTALVNINKAQIVSRPYVTARSREEAKIEIADESFFLVQMTESGVSIAANDSVSAGMLFSVTPAVQSNGMIRIKMSVEDSQFVTSSIATELISKERKTASTSMSVRSGQTIVVGGLNRQQSEVDRSGTPFLRKIPVIKWLTRAKDSINVDSEVVVYLTPTIWEPNIDVPITQFDGVSVDQADKRVLDGFDN